MEDCQSLPNRFALILDTEAIRAVVARVEELKLTRRECRPLDQLGRNCTNADLAKYDAELEAASVADEELDNIEAAVGAGATYISEHAELAYEDQ